MNTLGTKVWNYVDPAQPINWRNSLNIGTASWWLNLPQGPWGGGTLWPTAAITIASMVFFKTTNEVMIDAEKTAGTADAYQVFYNNNNQIRFTIDNTALTTTSTIALNVWTHVACTWDGATMTIYFNGVSVKTGAKSGTMTYTSKTISIGRNATASGFFVSGAMDDVRICNRALSGTEVLALYQSSLQGHPRTLNRIRRFFRTVPVSTSTWFPFATITEYLTGEI